MKCLTGHLRMFLTSGRTLQGPSPGHKSLTLPPVWHRTELSWFSLTCAVVVQFTVQGMAFGHRGVTGGSQGQQQNHEFSRSVFPSKEDSLLLSQGERCDSLAPLFQFCPGEFPAKVWGFLNWYKRRWGEARLEPISFRIGKYSGDSLMGQYTVPRNCCGFLSWFKKQFCW